MGAFLRPTEERKAGAGIVPAVEEIVLPEPVEVTETAEAAEVEVEAPKTRSRRPPTAKE